MTKDQAYHQIALACLKALRSSPTANNPSDALYQAIDQAFANQNALLLMELEECHDRLNAIAALSPEHDLAHAQAIANRIIRSH